MFVWRQIALWDPSDHTWGVSDLSPGRVRGVSARFFQGTKQDNGKVEKVGGDQMPVDGGEQTVPGSRVQLLVIFICAVFWIRPGLRLPAL